ncbi:MAG TPA: BamA/TamA family outer membrane protein [Kofleriaceae bacterium]|nr:BamA/TamA family outer membrane protein [Kofleriaceae bacterium]
MIGTLGCRHPSYVEVPGDTAIGVSEVRIVPSATSNVAYQPLLDMLGLRARSLILPERTFNAFRLAEDRRRIASYLQEKGRFDAVVDEPRLAWAADHRSVAVTWPVTEGAAYTVGSVTLVGAPPDHAAALRRIITFDAGAPIDVDTYRLLRLELAQYLQDRGYGQARGYSRVFVDRATRTVAWFYYVDPGPLTRIGSIRVEGNARVPAAIIEARAGLAVGAGFSTRAAHRAELALLDTGAFASVAVVSDADIQRFPEYPDSGGVMAPSQIAPDGTLVPRAVPAALAVRIAVVEAPATQVRAELGVEADPTRLDTYAGARLTFRDLFGPLRHLIVEGNVGYGWTFDDAAIARGVYGSALVQYLQPVSSVELRLTGRWSDVLYPDALLRELTAGPGIRAVPVPGGELALDVLYRDGRTRDLPAIDRATAGSFTAADSHGVELVGHAVVDRRDDRVEPTRGWLLGLDGSYSPGGALADHRWLELAPDARAFVPLIGSWSLALRASAGWVLVPGANGVPLGPRLFGGGAYGMRGFGRDQLSPAACAAGTACTPVLIGGRSLAEASAELRLLPYRKQYGAVAFVDAGGAGAATDPFASGVSLAPGIGGRVRLWYLPIALDVAYRALDAGRAGLAFDRLLAFVRIGEAF